MREPPDLQAIAAAKLRRSAAVLIAAEYVRAMCPVQAGRPRGIRGSRAYFFADETARRGIQCETGDPWEKPGHNP